jgi:hypothetical protein
LWEDWTPYADQVLDDQQLLNMVYEALTKRRPTSRTRGRLGTPAESGSALASVRSDDYPEQVQKGAAYASTGIYNLESQSIPVNQSSQCQS